MEARKNAIAAAPAPPGPPKLKVVVPAYSFRQNGWPYIRKAGLTFGVTLLLSVALVGAGRMLLFKARPDATAAQERQVAARQRLMQAQTERIEIRDFQPRFEQLQARGFVGPENRLALVEAIQAIQKTRKLLPVTFSLAPQQLVVVDPMLLGAPLELHATGVSLRMEMLHEMDLVNFFQDLKTRGFFSVKECILISLGNVLPDPLAPRLTAECTIYWLTVGQALPVDPNAVPVAQ